jgi:hypothetical protein
MKKQRLLLAGLVVAGLCLGGCAPTLSKEEFQTKEVSCLQAYCASNALAAEASLRECAQYAEACQRAGIQGIQYDEVFARIYGRLYVVERRLGQSQMAEECLQRYARHHAVLSSLARQTGRPHGEMERLIEVKFDDGMQTAWKDGENRDATGKAVHTSN